MDHTADQSSIRRNGLRARRALSELQRLSYSLRIADRLERLPVFRSATCVAVYLSSWDEVDTSEIILRSWRANKRVVAPVIKKSSRLEFVELAPQTRLRNNIYGLQEPASSRKVAKRDIDIVITPLASFDTHAARVGMGGGYYDRFFSSLATRHSYRRPRLVGVAFASQQSAKIPENPWDIPLYACITEDRIHAF